MRYFLIALFLYSSSLLCQDYKIIKYGDQNKFMLVGITDREAYQDSIFAGWFNSEYTNYKVNTQILNEQKHLLNGKLIKIVLGTWCSDSRREVPRFIKILDFLEFPSDKVMFLNVDREMNGLSNEADKLNIEFVPTFIVYESGEELGRIVETPIETLERDLLSIISLSY